jgi:hypothetical protein
MNFEITPRIAQRVLGAVDLAIDFATLGEYGLEPLPADGPCRERPGRKTGWEALTAARSRGRCELPAPACEAAPEPRIRLRDLG